MPTYRHGLPSPFAHIDNSSMDQASAKAPFYVVSMGKFSALFISTMGLYQLYWFYKHWQLLGAAQERNTLPFLRAIFDIFFITFLCKEIAEEEKKQGQNYRWNPQAVALGFIAINIISFIIRNAVIEKAIGQSWLMLLLPLFFGNYYYLYKIQLVANRVCHDPFGHANSTITPINHAWVIFGMLSWSVNLYLLVSGQISL
ncbi:hypothetical protein [Marinagarivorans cellulosilyticus]|uniref:DUF4234 domain-containing protein n=1 Tax=Marinagarivorans cellulosilyticus TaxID=2721545 RepID=A0AAN1WKY8_9GAMM|nr:hypothetical protein [Marinagarivorans cellulosilyticus]BCD99494.1 hypothetical protein MARGE09_P3696 [Marinagarivorans cellulosilyticus]